MAVQLDQLLATKDEVLHIGDGRFPTLADRIGTLKRRKRIIYASLSLLLFMTAVLLVIDHHLIQGTLLCSGASPEQNPSEEDYKRAFRGYLRHKTLWLIAATINLIWLTVPACMLSRILKEKVEDAKGFRRDIRKIHGINIAFILAIIYEAVFAGFFILNFNGLIRGSKGDDLIKFIKTMKVLTLSLAAFVPVGAITINHFCNIQSLNRVFKLLWRREAGEEEMQAEGEADNEITVNLVAASEV